MNGHLVARSIARSWWSIALRGVIAIAAGIIAFAAPHITFATLMLIVGAYFLLDGVFCLVNGARHRSGWTIVRGVLDLAAGIAIFAWPVVGAVTIVYLVALWAIAAGCLDIVGAIEFRRELSRPVLMGLGGAATVILGCIAIANPGIGALTLSFIFGAYAIVFGVLMLGLAYQMRALPERLTAREVTPVEPRRVVEPRPAETKPEVRPPPDRPSAPLS